MKQLSHYSKMGGGGGLYHELYAINLISEVQIHCSL